MYYLTQGWTSDASPLLPSSSLVRVLCQSNQQVDEKATRRPASQQARSRAALRKLSELSDVVTFSSKTPLGPANEVVSLIAHIKINWKGTGV